MNKRILLFGNSGSGKTWLSKKLSEKYNIPITHIDDIFWEPGGFYIKREKNIVHEEIKKISNEENWIMEGVFGDLATIASERATLVIYMDKSWEECKMALLSRGSELSKQKDKVEAEKSFKLLLEWAGNYWTRESLSSKQGHSHLFNSITCKKVSLKSRADVDRYLDS